ncbi:MAG: 4Fe-4S ferredoxin [Desulfovibrio sp.]|nr:MAG: 4Fe-4S ferredoxin [Desulfovibrio sp.]
MKYLRKMIRIDEDKCTGCGECVPGCEEGALQIIDGKAKLVSEIYCDGLGACLGHCPEGALRVIEVKAEDFNPEAVKEHLAQQGRNIPDHMPAPEELRISSAKPHPAPACPGARQLTPCQRANESSGQTDGPSNLGHWPIQLRLVNPEAPFLKNAEILLTADCVPVALAGYHDMIGGKAVLLGCPKFDDAEGYVAKLADIFRTAALKKVTILEMDVPCCSTFTRLAMAARKQAGAGTDMERVTVARTGGVLAREDLPQVGILEASLG